jgi:hypothetical protein
MNLEDLAKRIREACLEAALGATHAQSRLAVAMPLLFQSTRKFVLPKLSVKANYQYDFRLAFFEYNMR